MTVPKKTLAALFASSTLLLAGCGSSSDSTAADSASPSETAGASESPAAPASSAAPGECAYTADGTQASREVQAPSSTPAYKGNVKVTIKTNRGTMNATLDGKNAPCAVNAVTSLAKQKFYDDTPCHRVAVDSRGFHILQCGDPSGSGMGGPGYAYSEEVTAQSQYPAGTLAMANTGQPGSTGSQFFVVFGKTGLPPSYTVLGKLTPAGLATAKKIGADAVKGQPNGYDGAPVDDITIKSFTVNG